MSRPSARRIAAPGPSDPTSSHRERGGTGAFTLIEVVAAVALTSIVILIAVTLYIQISTASQRALDTTKDGRIATALLDRVARDLQGAFLIEKPDEVDPLSHPWFFKAESRYSTEGSDQLLFVSTTQRPGSREHSTDVATVGYSLRPSTVEFEGFDLIRGVVPGRPSEVSDDYPHPEDPAAMVLAEGVADFSLRFQGPDGQYDERWDSTQLVRSSQLPQTVEIRVALFESGAEEANDGFLENDPLEFVRRVALPIRPLSQEALFEGAAFGTSAEDQIDDENPNNCEITWGQCILRQAEECRDSIARALTNSGSSATFQRSGAAQNCFRGAAGGGLPPCFDRGLCQ